MVDLFFFGYDGGNREAILNHQEDDSDAGRWYDLMTMTLDSFEIDTIEK